MGNLVNGILDCEGRLLEDTGIQMLQSNGLLVLLFFLLLWLVLDEETGKLYQIIGKGEHEDCQHHLKSGVEGSDTGTVDAVGCNLREHLKQDCEDHGKDCYTDDVEQKVNHSCSLRRTVGTDTGKKGCGTGTDIRTKTDKYGCTDADRSARCSQSLKNTNCCRGALHDNGYDKTKADTQKRVRTKEGKQILEGRKRRVGFGRISHEIQTDKQKSKTDADLTDGLLSFLLGKHDKKRADSHDQGRIQGRGQGFKSVSQLA